MHAVTGSGRLIAGRYRLQGPIGRGAMGIVWRGRDELLARDVAVKEVQITALASPSDAEGIYQRTLREARTAARLKHPSVVTVFDVVEENGSPWIIMELVEARSLDRVIIEDGPLPPLQAAELGANLISALATAHSAGVLHRDVKPSNVLVTEDGRAVLTDFGIATFSEDPATTQAGMVVGTPGFTAPERIRGDVATPAADLWSLGATLYAAVEGRGPFDRVGGSTVITVGVANEDAPRAPSAGPLAPVIDALLSRDPGTRPDATTTSQLLADAVTAARTGARHLGDGWLAAEAGTLEHSPAADPAEAAAHRSVAANDLAEQRAAFLDPPVFAQLAMPDRPGSADSSDGSFGSIGSQGSGDMPVLAGAGAGIASAVAGAGADAPGAATGLPAFLDGAVADADLADQPVASGSDGEPVLWEPFKPTQRVQGGGLGAGLGGSAAGGSGASGQAGGGGPSGPDGGNGGLRFWRWDRPWTRRGRLMVAGIGVAAIVVAAVIGWGIYTGTQTPSALQGSTPPGASGIAAGGSAKPGSGGSAGTGGNHTGSGNTPTSGGSGGTAGGHGSTQGGGKKPGTSPSGKPTGGTSGGPSTSPSGGTSPSGSPSPSPSPTGPVLPAGWVWHHFTAAVMGATAGFKIGLPSAWTQSVSGLVADLNQTARSFHLSVNLGLWRYVKPLAQAQYLKGVDAHSYHDFKLLTLAAIGFNSISYRSASAAEVKFSWTKLTGGSFTEEVILVTLSTSSGVQSYTFTLWAPTSTFSAAYGVFHTAMQSFRPLPGI